MKLDELIITKAIVDRYFRKLTEHLDLDVAVVGGGPSGLVAAYKLAKAGKKVVIYERRLSVGGGMWGGGMLFNEIVIQEEAKQILDELEVRAFPYEVEGYYTADSVEAVSTITSKTVKAGAVIFNGISVEDVVVHDEGRIQGLVVNWTAIEMSGLHVDPLSVRCKYVIDATGHDTEVVKVVARKMPGKLLTATGNVEGEKFMSADKAEKLTIENTREVFPGLYVAGMAANATFGGPRMGPIFGGMLLSGVKVARDIVERL
ncbi:MAG: sulfide-dependent adenosine diphosphate thiazole synthase [Acetomicrobium sp.]|jgi:thiazole biosynthesis enzyme|uniref:sulfide-dependent adenosine diphosphate thiazole synthase n=1 Tax=Acetomicrobium TaxID=49894 RepID=UPI0026F047DA|nr:MULTISPECIES: sulfide-dependent adenosine diphosphate thiazole synthase [Acetomicrobium]MDI9377787.1 sulfide-dependent adenosine diphosphate thiazole synthase [Synergistota bacterium]MDR9770147.1 sulfide-dependent adenosine diphosphate thiazole synthase [Acetomicrobium sp.]HOB10852.1 sulfide-dependent adenosine diphosphate thiazole synthase [Acetomicrobium sp.]HOM96674.1 sulfide-dependent adenosine diphosphate thiazole synthase [Acetomicrobium sp.]HQA36560.1 sulfide-dependent adenosine diph